MADQSLLLSVSVTYNDMIIRWASLQLQALDILDGKSLSQVLTPPSCLRFGTLSILRFGTLPNLRQVREPSPLVSHACAGVIVLCALNENRCKHSSVASLWSNSRQGSSQNAPFGQPRTSFRRAEISKATRYPLLDVEWKRCGRNNVTNMIVCVCVYARVFSFI